MKTILILLTLFFCQFAQANTETHASRYFDSIKDDPQQLYQFLKAMPKGGDLHNHLTGAEYAENLIAYAKDDNWCVDTKDFSLKKNRLCPDSHRLQFAYQDAGFYREITHQWSMRDFIATSSLSNEQHFFDTFAKFGPIVTTHIDKSLYEVAARAASQNVSYLEILLTSYDLGLIGRGGDVASELSQKIAWSSNLNKLYADFLQHGIKDFAKAIPTRIDRAEAEVHNHKLPITIRYQYLALRESSPVQFFAQLILAFEAAQADKRIVGINIVQAEDGPIATRDYDLHMKMIAFLHAKYPAVHISLHAGELSPTSVAPETLRFHIRNAVEIGHAERIGHGVDIAYENAASQLIKEMAAKKILVEINLTSNKTLLNVEANAHPFLYYLKNNVPVALSTDDEGILRTDLTHEYMRAVQTYHLDYLTLKQLARNSLVYSFSSAAEKAQLLQDLEKRFAVFEKKLEDQTT